MTTGPRSLLALIAALPLAGCERAPSSWLVEASGIVRAGDRLVIVGDGSPGGYASYPIPPEALGPFEWQVFPIPIDPTRLEPVRWTGAAALASDLESVDTLADGRLVVLSEDMPALVCADGVVARYDDRLAEVSGRGLEGLSVLPLQGGRSRLAVLWEGGWVKPAERAAAASATPYRPVVVIHDLELGCSNVLVSLDAGAPSTGGRVVPARFFALVVPDVPGDPAGSRFRAPDLVWREGPDGTHDLIVLLSAVGLLGHPRPWTQWLQRFDLEGRPVGEPLDLGTILQPTLARDANWEGLGWFEAGRSVVLVHDQPPRKSVTACVLRLPEDW